VLRSVRLTESCPVFLAFFVHRFSSEGLLTLSEYIENRPAPALSEAT
jgi:hypothetical protein